jgi:hypothetical protein
MRFDGTGAYVEARGNFLVEETFGDARKDFALANCESGRVGTGRDGSGRVGKIVGRLPATV